MTQVIMPEPLESDDGFVRRLAALHEQLMTGSAVTPTEHAELPADVAEALDSSVQVLRLIERVQRFRVDDTVLSDSTAGRPAGNEVSEPADVASDVLPAWTESTQTVGRFEIRRELGRGGYGIVFLAYDSELDRDVALKIPRPEAILTEEMQDRFVREGRAAALLAHPNIVPVFETGRLGSVCYIVSRHVAGASLADYIKARQARPIETGTAAHIVAALADGVAHAHSKGVVHRDLKPSNILLEGVSEDGLVAASARVLAQAARITDFGLAKTTGDATDLTGSGSIVGTPAYMSPEQAHGRPGDVQASSDIYALGVILYEMLTGAPPFAGDSVVATLRQVQEKEPPRPSAGRPWIDRDLEAICLRCLEKRPQQRYDSATSLQQDLKSYLAGEPVVARPVGPLRRLKKWSTRNPALATVSAVFVISTTSALVALGILWGVAESRGRHLSKEVLAKNSALNLAQTRSQQLTRSIQDLFQVLAESPEIKTPQAEPLRRKVIEQAEKVYASILEESAGDPQLQLERARSIFEVAQILNELGAAEGALDKVTQALDLAKSLKQSAGSTLDPVQLNQAIGNWSVFKGIVESRLARFDEARDTFRDGLSSFEGRAQVTAAGPDAAQQTYVLAGLAHAMAQQALSEIQAKRIPEALRASSESESLWRQLMATDAPHLQDVNTRFLFANSLFVLGQVYDVAVDLPKSEELFAEAIAVADSLDTNLVSSMFGARGLAAACYHRYGVAIARQGDLNRARDVYNQSIERLEQLVSDFPDVAHFRETLGHARYSLAFTEYLSKDYPRAKELIMASVTTDKDLLQRWPDTAAVRWDHIGDDYGVIFMIEQASDAGTDAQMQALASAAEAYEQSLQIRHDWREPLVGLARAHAKMAILQMAEDHLDEAEAHLDQAHRYSQEVFAAQPDWYEARQQYAAICHNRAQLAEAKGEDDRARQHYRQALETLRDKSSREPIFDLVRFLARTGNVSESQRELRAYVADLATEEAEFVAAISLAVEMSASDSDTYQGLAEELIHQGAESLPDLEAFLLSLGEAEQVAAVFDRPSLEQLVGRNDEPE